MGVKKKYDIVSEEMQLYFDDLVANMTESERKEIPRDLFFRVKKGKTNFIEKIALMWKVFKKDCYIVIKNEEDGMTAKDFELNRRQLKHDNYGEDAVRDYVAKGGFVLGADSICLGLHYEALLSSSPMYRYVSQMRGLQSNELAGKRKELLEFSKMAINYESSKKAMLRQQDLTIAEWLILVYFSDGTQKTGAALYTTLKFDAFGAGKSRVLAGLKKLTFNGHLQKSGKTCAALYKISQRGMDKYYTCLTQYVFNY